MRMRSIFIRDLPCSKIFFPHYLINGKIIEEINTLLNIKFVFWFSPIFLSVTFLLLRKTERDMIKNVRLSSCWVPVILVRSWRELNFLDKFSKKKTHVSNFMKIRPVGAELFHVDWGTDKHEEANGRFSQFWESTWKLNCPYTFYCKR